MELLSTFSWLDYSERDRTQMLNVLALFRENDTRDEMGLGAIRDAWADLLFPGTSTIQTRARYLLFVPWIYQRVEKRATGAAQIASALRVAEIELLHALLKSDESEGIIGRVARDKLQRLPSNIYEVAQSAPLLAAGMNGLEEGTDSMSVSSSEVLEVGGGSMPPSTSCRGR